MEVRIFRSEDIVQIIRLFRKIVHEVCRKDYSIKQLEAWAPSSINESEWCERFSNSFTYVVEQDCEILGFSNLESNGNIDLFYVHNEYQGHGVGKLLYCAIETKAKFEKLFNLTSDVSITAKPFFLHMGFKVDEVYIKKVKGVEFRNNLMSKKIKL